MRTVIVKIAGHPLNNTTWEFFGDRTRRMVPRAGGRAEAIVMADVAWGGQPLTLQAPNTAASPTMTMLGTLWERYRDTTPSGDYSADGYGEWARAAAAAGR